MNDDDIRAVKKELSKLYSLVGKLAVGTGIGLIGHGGGQLGIKALRRSNLGNYNELMQGEKDVVDEIVHFISRFGVHYFKHHKEAAEKRNQATRARGGYNRNELEQQMADLEEMLESHAIEILNAATGAVSSRIKSHGYDFVVGKPKRTSIFMRDDVIKQFVTASINEIHDGLATQWR